MTLSNSRIEILNINRVIDKAQIETAEYDLIQQATIENSKILLLEKIKQWEETYLLKSPINGVVNFHNYLITENKNVLDGEDVFSIVPDEFGQLFGVLFVPFNKSGKVEIGQNVNIFLDNFPAIEYGVLKGKVSNISRIQSNDGYLAKIDLPQNLVTSFNTKIEFKSSLIGKAEIITEDMSILERIFNKFRDVFVN
ncbi:HlyD family secretion protein [Lacinutrix neustonica]|uniref:HlyD family secretion protein n=1 Tax=Lacinutrix neustonica TaxID=2980107 RepID=A0A9E8SCU9_9FLAO|nr:HlyD family secretion protein [Lacinutrix neustonica]WAC01728.1 HlyD family secretion protein [Lacinutrix neustonica]